MRRQQALPHPARARVKGSEKARKSARRTARVHSTRRVQLAVAAPGTGAVAVDLSRPGAHGRIGTVGLDFIYGPSFRKWHGMSFLKTLAVTEAVRVQFRAESFNFLNELNLANPNACVDFPAPPAASSALLPTRYGAKGSWH